MINKKGFSVLGTIAVITMITPWLDGSKVASQELSSEQQIQNQTRALEGSWRSVVTVVYHHLTLTLPLSEVEV